MYNETTDVVERKVLRFVHNECIQRENHVEFLKFKLGGT